MHRHVWGSHYYMPSFTMKTGIESLARDRHTDTASSMLASLKANITGENKNRHLRWLPAFPSSSSLAHDLLSHVQTKLNLRERGSGWFAFRQIHRLSPISRYAPACLVCRFAQRPYEYNIIYAKHVEMFGLVQIKKLSYCNVLYGFRGEQDIQKNTLIRPIPSACCWPLIVTISRL